MRPFMTAACLALLAAPLMAQQGSPAGPVAVELLIQRRAALMERLGDGVALLRSAANRSIEAEGDHPQDSDFRQDNDFFYLTGLEVPDSWLLLIAREAGEDEEILFIPARDSAAERWTGPKLGPGPVASELTGIQDTRPSEGVEQAVRRIIFGRGSPAWQGGLYVRRGDRGPREERELVRDLSFAGTGRPVALHDLGYQIAQLRLVKDEDEVRRLQRAIDITAASLREAMAALTPEMWEYQVEAIIEHGFRSRGAERLGFPSIVGAGDNSTTLHYDKSRGKLLQGDLIVMDVGAEFGYYSADVTRTAPVSGRFSERQRQLYDLVLATQQAAIDSVRPGVTIGQLNGIARTFMRENSGDLCQPGTCDRYFIHGLSHWLGMDVHDVGDYGTPLRAGMVLTIEPGIYIPQERIGIRIEDDLLVTDQGYRLMSDGAPRTADAIEEAMND